jgi:bile acid-coenzyme A ligase
MQALTLVPYGRRFTDLAEADPNRPAITCEDETVTRAELERRANGLARRLLDLGVAQGDFVTIALPNGVAFVEACVAAWKIGAIPQPLSSRLPVHELQTLIELADPAVLIGVEPTHAPGRRCLPHGLESDTSLPDTPLPDVVSPAWAAPASGGSTGRPKLIVAGRPAELDPSAPAPLRLERGRTIVVPGPLYHNGPIVFTTLGLLLGNHVILGRRFDPESTLAAVERFHADVLYLVPTMMLRIWRLPEERRASYDLSSLRIVWHMAAPCPPWLKEAWIDWIGGERIWELYGGTETIAGTQINGSEWLDHRGSVGRCSIGEIKILDPDGREVAPREVGEIFMRTQGPPSYRYVGAEPRERNGWESLGDLGWMDEEGYLYLTDRRTDLILSGGANIYPAEVEAAIEAHPAVRSSAVIGLPDDDLGQRVHAIVQVDAPVDEKVLIAHLADRLVRYKVPRSIEFTTEPLRDDAGKVRRSALRSARDPSFERESGAARAPTPNADE